MVVFTRAPEPVLVEVEAPMWAQRMVLRLKLFFQPLRPVQPTRFFYVNKVDLPPATDWPGAMCVVVDQDCLAVARDGVWRRISLAGPV